jgi:hypothetical protein
LPGRISFPLIFMRAFRVKLCPGPIFGPAWRLQDHK